MIHKQFGHGSMHNKNKSLFDAHWCPVIRLNVLLCLAYVLRRKPSVHFRKERSMNKIKSDTCVHTSAQAQTHRQFVENPKLGINGYYFTQVLILHSNHSYLSIMEWHSYSYDIGVVCLVKAFKLSDPIVGNRTVQATDINIYSILFIKSNANG